MRGMVVPSTPCCPSTSAAAFKSLRVDSRLRACWGASVFLAMVLLYIRSIKIMLDTNVNANIHLHMTTIEHRQNVFGLFAPTKILRRFLWPLQLFPTHPFPRK